MLLGWEARKQSCSNNIYMALNGKLKVRTSVDSDADKILNFFKIQD